MSGSSGCSGSRTFSSSSTTEFLRLFEEFESRGQLKAGDREHMPGLQIVDKSWSNQTSSSEIQEYMQCPAIATKRDGFRAWVIFLHKCCHPCCVDDRKEVSRGSIIRVALLSQRLLYHPNRSQRRLLLLFSTANGKLSTPEEDAWVAMQSCMSELQLTKPHHHLYPELGRIRFTRPRTSWQRNQIEIEQEQWEETTTITITRALCGLLRINPHAPVGFIIIMAHIAILVDVIMPYGILWMGCVWKYICESVMTKFMIPDWAMTTLTSSDVAGTADRIGSSNFFSWTEEGVLLTSNDQNLCVADRDNRWICHVKIISIGAVATSIDQSVSSPFNVPGLAWVVSAAFVFLVCCHVLCMCVRCCWTRGSDVMPTPLLRPSAERATKKILKEKKRASTMFLNRGRVSTLLPLLIVVCCTSFQPLVAHTDTPSHYLRKLAGTSGVCRFLGL
jgi:hypothetical protein